MYCKHQTVGCPSVGALPLFVLLMVHRRDIFVVRAETRVHPLRDVGSGALTSMWVHARIPSQAAS